MVRIQTCLYGTVDIPSHIGSSWRFEDANKNGSIQRDNEMRIGRVIDVTGRGTDQSHPLGRKSQILWFEKYPRASVMKPNIFPP